MTNNVDPIDLDPLTGDLVRLRELHDADLPNLVEWWSDPAVAAYQVEGPGQPRLRDQVSEMLRGFSRNEGIDCGFVVESKESGEAVGHVAIHGAEAKNRCAMFGIFIGPPHQGRGFGGEATRLILRYAFQEINLHRIELGVYSFNERAIAAYQRAGFVEEGRLREAIFRSGAWHDKVLMGMLRSEWTG